MKVTSALPLHPSSMCRIFVLANKLVVNLFWERETFYNTAKLKLPFANQFYTHTITHTHINGTKPTIKFLATFAYLLPKPLALMQQTQHDFPFFFSHVIEQIENSLYLIFAHFDLNFIFVFILKQNTVHKCMCVRF